MEQTMILTDGKHVPMPVYRPADVAEISHGNAGGENVVVVRLDGYEPLALSFKFITMLATQAAISAREQDRRPAPPEPPREV